MASLAPLVIYNEHTVLGVANTAGANSAGLGVHTIDFSAVAVGNTTINSIGNTTANSTGANGYTVLPGGVIMQWGTGVAGTPATFVVKFPANVLSFHVQGTQANVTLATANSTTVSATASAGTPTFSYIAVGR